MSCDFFGQRSSRGFTLAELLISLAILGVIATFTIPKILSTQQNQKYNAGAKEVAATITGAYQQLQLIDGVNANTRFGDLVPFINYMGRDTTLSVNAPPGYGNYSCGSNFCYKLASGGVLWTNNNTSFGGTTPLSSFYINYDPDASVDIPGSGIQFWLFYSGKITTVEDIPVGASSSWGSVAAVPNGDPSWFSWN